MLQCFRNGSFLIRRALRLLGILRFGLVVILPINDTTLLLYLSDIEVADLQASMLQNIRFDLLISRQPSFILHQLLNIHINADITVGFFCGTKVPPSQLVYRCPNLFPYLPL